MKQNLKIRLQLNLPHLIKFSIKMWENHFGVLNEKVEDPECKLTGIIPRSNNLIILSSKSASNNANVQGINMLNDVHPLVLSLWI